jgi:hypothetical protein
MRRNSEIDLRDDTGARSKMHALPSFRSKRTSAGNDFREMEDSTRWRQARSPRGNPNL